MAAIKRTHSSKAHTRQDFPEVKNKIVDTVELSAQTDYYGITIRFQDKTALTFVVEPYVVAFPIYSDWTGGEEKLLKRYGLVRSEVPRA
ncbi:MAG TPA: hypothetical protein VKZ53_02820 [Candidatus Angelobacter sp.]|nr:hypothetical protein [Candidatus Angelobacter sp.]